MRRLVEYFGEHCTLLAIEILFININVFYKHFKFNKLYLHKQLRRMDRFK